MYRPTLLIDLDGVLNQYGKEKYNEFTIPKIKDRAKEFIKKLYSLNKYDLVLFTTRNMLLASKWLIKNKLDIYFKDITNTKIPATIHIDDRALNFNGNYEETLAKIKDFKTYWKNERG